MPNDSARHRRTLLSVMVGQILAAGTWTVQAADITVDDTGPGAGGANCTIRDAITAANTDAVVAGCSAGAGADRVLLPASSTITLNTVDNDISNCLPEITTAITIVGNNSTIQRSGAGPDCRFFDVTPAGDLTIEDSTLSGGRLDAGGLSRGYDNEDVNGGAIFSDGGNVSITGSTISGNFARRGGGIYVTGDAELTLEDSTVSGNTAEVSGGGINSRYASVYAKYLTLTNNTAESGGGAYILGTAIPRSSKAGPIVQALKNGERPVWNRNKGGGKYEASFVSSVISGNRAQGAGPTKGILPPGASGGGINVTGGTVFLYESQVTGNDADAYGGGLSAKYGVVGAIFSTISGNTATFGGGIGINYGVSIGYYATISDNEAVIGGGLGNAIGGTGLLSSTVSGNRAVLPGPARGILGTYGSGAGLYGVAAFLVLQNSTVSGNSAAGEGGGVAWSKYGSPTSGGVVRSVPEGLRIPAEIQPTGPKYEVAITHSTIAFNDASAGPTKGAGFATQFFSGNEVRMFNSIIANPGVGDCLTLDANPPAAIVATLIQDGSCNAPITGDPLLGPLQDNGGPTLSHAIAPGSPAEGAGDAGVCAAEPTDQTGDARPATGCNLGSVQALGTPPPSGIPTLSQWGQAIMAMLLAAMAAVGLRRRRPEDP